MAPIFFQATPDRAFRFLIPSAVNRRVASSNLARGANLNSFNELNSRREFGCLLNRLAFFQSI
jgi:hypothetical protein